MVSARLAYRDALGIDSAHQVVPGLHEGRGALVLQAVRESIDVDARLGEASEHRLAVAAISRHHLADLAVFGDGLEGAFRHGVYREGRGERPNIQGVGCLRILGAGARPQQALGARTTVGSALERSEEHTSE